MPNDKSYAPWPVWSDSVEKPIKFKKMSRAEAHQIYWDARELDRATKKGGRCHGGDLGPTALRVLETLVYEFLNYKTGRLDPSYAQIALKANLSVSAVHTALKRLRKAGILTWVRRCKETMEDGRYVRRQASNAYALISCPAKAVRPTFEWGQPVRVPSLLEQAAQEPQIAAIATLALGEPGSLEAALARLGRTLSGLHG